ARSGLPATVAWRYRSARVSPSKSASRMSHLLQSAAGCDHVHVAKPVPLDSPMYTPTGHAGEHLLPAPCSSMSALWSPLMSPSLIPDGLQSVVGSCHVHVVKPVPIDSPMYTPIGHACERQ